MEHRCPKCNHLICNTNEHGETDRHLDFHRNENGTFTTCPECSYEREYIIRTTPEGLEQYVAKDQETFVLSMPLCNYYIPITRGCSCKGKPAPVRKDGALPEEAEKHPCPVPPQSDGDKLDLSRCDVTIEGRKGPFPM